MVVKQECPNCRGKGKVWCEPCGGKGYKEERRSRQDAYGRLIDETERTTCTTCHGEGERICNYCSGAGYNLVPGQPEVVPPAPDGGNRGTRTPAEYAELYRCELERAEQERIELLTQLPSTGEFAQVWDAICKLNLADPKAEADLKVKADYLDRPGAASSAKKLAKMMRDLAFRLRGLKLYREMAAPRPGS
jgi:hypothetical protein